MPQFNEYKADGRELMVKFTCARCKEQALRPLKDQDTNPQSYGLLHRIEPPKGWKDLLHGPLLCAECIKAYEEFMKPIPEERAPVRPEKIKEATT